MRADAGFETCDGGRTDEAVGTARFKIKGDASRASSALPPPDARPNYRACVLRADGAREDPAIVSRGGGGKDCVARAPGTTTRRNPVSARCAGLNDMCEIDTARGDG